MDIKKYLIMGGVIVALVAIVVLSQITISIAEKKWKAIKGEVNKIEITKNGVSLTIEKSDKGWFFLPEGYKADSSKIDALVELFKEKREFELISVHPIFSKFELDEANAIEASFYVGKEKVRNLKIGKGASTYKHTYVMFGKEEKIYQTEGSFRADFDKSAQDLRDKNVLTFNREAITSLTLTDKSGKSVEINKVSVNEPAPAGAASNAIPTPTLVWEDSNKVRYKVNEIDDILNVCSSLRTEEYLVDKSAAFVQKAISYKVVAKSLSETFEVQLFGDLNEKTEATSSQSEWAFLLDSASASKIRKDFNLIKE